MLKKSYLVIGSIIISLLISSNVFAYSTGYSTVTGTDLNNNTFSIRGINYWDLYPENYSEAGMDNYSAEWNVIENYQITNLKQGNYYTGILRFRVQISGYNSGLQRHQPVMQTNNIDTGLYTYIQGNTGTFYQIDVVFDNYYCENESLGLPTVFNTFSYPFNSEIGLTNYAQTFTTTLTIQLANFRSQATPFNNGLAGMITSSIDNSTALATIAGWLYDIKVQDYTYYSSLTTQIANLINGQSTTNVRLLSILNEIDLDFQQVQTILDLFPSYRTQVLTYWQELLAMNAAQSSAAAEVESEYADKEAQSETLAAGLGQLVLPSVSSNDFNVLNQVDGTQKANFFGLLSIITNNGFITTLLIIVVTGAIVGYILYGKK